MSTRAKPIDHHDRWAVRGRQAIAALRVGAVLSGLLALVAMPLPFGIESGSGAAPAPAAPTPATASPAAASAAATVAVAIDTHHPRAPVPEGFLGLSFEMSALPSLAGDGTHGDLVKLLRSLGPGVLRFGGVSADTQAAWTDRVTPLPSWASVAVTDGELRQLATLAARSGWHVLLTLGLAHFEPVAAAREAAAAKAALGKWLIGFELGNEPDAYAQHGLRPEPWTFTQYEPQALAYLRAIAKAAPHVPLAGPDVSGSHAFPRWGRPEAIWLRPALLTGHHYPLGCNKIPAPSIAGLLSQETRTKEQRSLGRYMAVSDAHRIPFRLTETGSVSCGGTAGISNTFASTLWAADYVADAMTSGLRGINFQGAPGNCMGYSPLCASTPARLHAGILRAQPEWYALLLARSLTGDRPLQSVIERSGGSDVDVRSLLAPGGGLRTIVIDDDPPGSPDATISLRLDRAFMPASVLALSGPSPQATSGVKLGGRGVNADGSFSEPRALPSIPDPHDTIRLTLAPSSAALLSAAPQAIKRRPRR